MEFRVLGLFLRFRLQRLLGVVVSSRGFKVYGLLFLVWGLGFGL